jgi:transposase
MDKQERKRVHHKAANGTIYVYEILESYWDKEKRQARNKQVCIGKLNPKTGELIPSKRLGKHAGAALDAKITARTTISGPALLLKEVDQQIGLTKILKKSSPEHWREIISLAWYLLATGNALSHAEVWCRNHEAPAKTSLSSQRISELLEAVDEDIRQTFFQFWGKTIAEKDYLCYDITSISSYAQQNELVRYGYNRDGEALPQINLGLVYGQKTMLPVSYRQLPGSINDVSTLTNLLDQLDKLEYPRLHLVLDRGFYSKNNVDQLAEKGHNFTLGLPIQRKWILEYIDKYRNLVDSPAGYHELAGKVVYAHTCLMSWGEKKRRCYLHLYFDPDKMARDRVEFDQQLAVYRNELLQGKRQVDHEPFYEQFFFCKTTPKRGLKVEFNWDAVTKARDKYAGFSALLSTKFKDPLQALSVYRMKDVVEKCFDDLKNTLDSKRLRVHRADRMKSRLFIQFISLILLSQVRKVLQEKLAGKDYSVKSLLWELESLTTIHYSGKYKNKLSELTKAQKDIFAAYDVKIDP